MMRLLKRGLLLTMSACMAGCDSPPTNLKKTVVPQAAQVASESIELTGKDDELAQYLGLPCCAEGVAQPFLKGYPALKCQHGIVLVQFAKGHSWPKAASEKRVKIRGVVSEYQPLTNAEGVPVNSEGQVVQGYSQPVYFIGHAEIVSIGD